MGYMYRAPRELRRSPFAPKRVLVIGACLSEPIAGHINSGGFNSAEYVVYNHLAPLPEKTKEEIDAFDFQIVQIPLRSLMPEGGYLRPKYSDILEYEKLFKHAKTKLSLMLDVAMSYNARHGVMTFVQNFMTPQQNPMGRLLPKYDIRNPVHFVRELNMHISSLIEKYNNCYLLDVDEITSNFGKRFYQDDSLWLINHGSILDHYDYPFDQDRINPPDPVYAYYDLRNLEYRAAVWHEAEALYESVRQVDAVKLVVIDLDDTLWRGELAERGTIPDVMIEGWPLGFLEALVFLKKRGVLLGIISKNTEEKIVELWDGAVAGLIKLDDFAVRRINWNPKPDNMREIMAETNLLPSNVVYVDDNPIQRAAMAEAYPEIRILGEEVYYNRRILLWSPETQGPTITEESTTRTEMIQAQALRETERKTIPQDAFLSGLDLTLTLDRFAEDGHSAFIRCLELINKTNQFNTTGRRWTLPEVQAFFVAGGEVYYATAKDRFTSYGVIFVAMVHQARIEQVVMSCRVVGLGIEIAALSTICLEISKKAQTPITALSIQTSKNLLSQDLFSRCGFLLDQEDRVWRSDSAVVPSPRWIALASSF